MPYVKSNKQIQDSAFMLKSGNTTPFKEMGSSPLKQDPLDLGLLDEARKFDKTYKSSTTLKTIPKLKDVTGKTLTNIVLKGDKLPAEKIAARTVKKKVAKKTFKTVAKTIFKGASKVASRFLGPVGWGLLAYDVATTIPKVIKSTEKSLKKQAETGQTAGFPKY